MKKIAMVCQRYGLKINGGSELHCRQLAEKLTSHYQVEVFTTCAQDYVTWKNEYLPGTEVINGVTVYRFPTDRERDTQIFNQQSEKVFFNRPHTDEDEQVWIEEQGPVCAVLIEQLSMHQKEYQAILFMTYLYYLTAKGILSGIDNALLIPTAHDEPPFYLRHYREVLRAPRGLIYNTTEEKELIEKRAQTKHIPSIIAGVGIEIPGFDILENACDKFGLNNHYITYVGRIDESKGCKTLFSYFLEYKRRHVEDDLQLVLMGKAVMDIPHHPDIISLGFVSDEDKFVVMNHAQMLVLASEFESLSMVVLESMALGRPVLVNGKCKVLKGHCIKSNAGLYFENYFEFEGALVYLLSHPQEYRKMQENACQYVAKNYQWNVIVDKICGLIEVI